MTTIAVLGLGEAGRRYATGLAAAGAAVTGFDPRVVLGAPGVDEPGTPAAAVADADVVLSLVTADAVADAAASALPHVRPGAVYADLNAVGPDTKQRVAALAPGGVAVADVAVLGLVPRVGHRTALAASGPGAAALARLLGPYGAPVEVLPGGIGDASRLKLVRSVFMKGLAALVIEGLDAARAAGSEEWLRAQIAAELGPDGASLVERLVEGTARHARRRSIEVADAVAMLEASGSHADMTRATLAVLRRIAAASPPPSGEPAAQPLR